MTSGFNAFRPLTCLTIASLTLLSGCMQHSRSDTDEASGSYQRMEASTESQSNSRVRHLVLHYTDDDLTGSLISLTGADVSAHYLLSAPADGEALPRVYPLVSENRRAWHAGISQWGERGHLNDTSIGIEMVNAGPEALTPLAPGQTETRASGVARRWSPDRHFAAWNEQQIAALIALASPIVRRHDIKAVDVVGHSDIAPDRKTDPGPRFPWRRLHEAGIGAWPRDADVSCFRRQMASDGLPAEKTLIAALAHYGYPLEAERPWMAIAAFQAHFRPGAISGQFDAESAAILLALNMRYRQSTPCQAR